MPDLIDLDAEGVKQSTEWSAAIAYLDGRVRRQSAGDDPAYAELIADSVATHLAMLDEDGRRANGVAGASVMVRTVRTLLDGTQVLHPWRHVRDSVPIKDEES